MVHGGVNPGSCFFTEVLENLERRREPDQDTDIFTSDPLNDFLWADPSDEITEASFNQQR